MSSFTNAGEEVVERLLDEGAPRPSSLSLEDMYEVTRCVAWALAGAYQRVCLQFPDELLGDAPAVAEAITQQLGRLVYILGDTTYGSCCVDEVAAEHIGADAVIHFGRTCLSPSQKLPVLYVHTRLPMEVSEVVKWLRSALGEEEAQTRRLILLCDTRCHYAAGDLFTELHSIYPCLVPSILEGGWNEEDEITRNTNTTHCCLLENGCKNASNCSSPSRYNSACDKGFGCSSSIKCSNCNNAVMNDSNIPKNLSDTSSNSYTKLSFNGRYVFLPHEASVKDYSFIYVGPKGPTLDSLLLRFSENGFYHVSLSDGTVLELSGMHSLLRRSAKLEMIRDAGIIGILVGTLGIAKYQEAISRLKAIIKSAGKRSYTFVVGKPNEPKLANISEIDIFVYVACPETTTIDRASDPALYRKLVAPWEVEVALVPGREWNLAFELDFRQLLPGGARHLEVPDEPLEEQASVSLITNRTQTLGLRENTSNLEGQSGAVMVQDGRAVAALHVGGGGQALGGRTWAGLDPSVPPPAPYPGVLEGRKGIASQYQDEKQ